MIMRKKEIYRKRNFQNYHYFILCTRSKWYLTIGIMYKILRNPGGIAQWLRHLLYKINDLSLISGAHTKVEGENQLHKEFFWLPLEYGGNTHTEFPTMYSEFLPPCTHWHTHTNTIHIHRACTHHTHSNTKTIYNNKFWKWRSKETINWNKYLLTQIGISKFLFNIVTMLLKRDSARSISATFLKAPLAILK